MVTKILLIIMLVLYVALLIMRYKKKDNPKIEGGVQVVQGILWSLIAVDNWAERSIGMRIVYIIIILMSFIVGIKELYRCRQYFLLGRRKETKKGCSCAKKKWLEQMAVMEKTAYFAERRKCR